MTTQAKALKVISQGGKIQNSILLDFEGTPIGQLKPKQITALLGKGLTKTVGFDQTVTIQ